MIAPNQFTTAWMDASELADRLEIGDLIEIRRVVGVAKRRIYAHWAVFIQRHEEKAYVVHVATDDGDFDVDVPEDINATDSLLGLKSKITKGSEAQVRRDELTRVARGDSCRINNSLDVIRRPFPPVVIVERALLMLGSGDYNILLNNCEHFVNYCRYGTRESEQATVAKSVIVGSAALLLSGSLPVAVATGCLGYTLSKFGYEIKKYLSIYPEALL
ncbi:HRAS-like suppressor 2 [Toxocara canis]|uniref:HRAS-like suppressor 2 n=2 Tax=Toxocara canis TaxID=6265 RepID=A0A0B2VWQ1_TOXCA|nr:HRAS-like suppressor 2 [Toxocara canis]VDM25768.1 unnamed protein product [Toxocara canis]